MKAVKKISLDGVARLTSIDRSIDIPISIPGSVFDALIEAGKLEDPFYGLNEQKSKWVFESEWIVFHEIAIDEELLEYKHLILKFYGIDTFATITLNGHALGEVDNMHRVYEFDIKPFAAKGNNLLKIQFKSPSKVANERSSADNDRIYHESFSTRGRSYTHKAQYSYGWDWGPILPDIGVWRSVELIAMDSARLQNFQILPTFSSDFQQVDLKVVIESEIAPEFSNKSNLEYKGWVKYLSPQPISFIAENKSKEGPLQFQFKPELWWIHELGTPNLYEITVELFENGVKIDSIRERTGFRELKLIQRPDQWGESFYFQINGVPLFAKGADWIPHHSFIPKGRRLGLYYSTLEDAKAANMTMLRVWGGGIMEDDCFYEICDEFGILIWQDFPFACSHIPPVWNKDHTPNEFYVGTQIHARQNVKRTRNHPSIALWCGNNEIEENAVRLNKDDPKQAELLDAYCEIAERFLPKLCAELDPTRCYWPSSPSSGGSKGTFNFPKPQLENIGDSHFWTVWHGGADFSAYRENFSRFQSEFGFESFPDIKTCAEFCPPDQYDFESPIMKNHQKNPAGNQKIMNYMKKRFKIPSDFKKQVVLSQITHAEAMEYGVEHWRRNRGTPGNERCMGSLYWQLNDCWPVASWSSIDYSKKLAEEYGKPGRWKALHYYARRFYKPVIISISEAKSQCEFWGVNDLTKNKSVKLEWEIIDQKGQVQQNGKKEIDLPALSSRLIDQVSVSELFGYEHLKQGGDFVIDDQNHLIIGGVDISKKCESFINQSVNIKINTANPTQADTFSTIMGITSRFSGICKLDEDQQLCLTTSISPTNPELYDVPLADLMEDFVGQEGLSFELETNAKNPPLIVIARIIKGSEIISESFRPFIAPGDIPLERLNLTLTVLNGNGTKWQLEVQSQSLAMYVHLYSENLDFWASDNYFILPKGKKRIEIEVLEPISSDELISQIKVNSLYDLLN